MEQPDDYPWWYGTTLVLFTWIPLSFLAGLLVGRAAETSPLIRGWKENGWFWALTIGGMLSFVQGIIIVAVEIRRYRNVKTRQASRTEF